VVPVASLVLVTQLYIRGRSEPPEDNSLACAELLTDCGMVTWPDINSFGIDLQRFHDAQEEANRTIEKIDWDRILLNCGNY